MKFIDKTISIKQRSIFIVKFNLMSNQEQKEEPVFPRKKLFPKISPAQIKTVMQFVPDQIYESDNDPIETTFDLLPHGTDPNFLTEIEALQRGQLEALDIVSRNLNQNLLENYTDVLKAMSLISDLNNQLNLSTQNIRQTRQVLHSAESEICDHPQTFFRQIQKQKNLKSVLDLLDLVQTITKSTDELNQALNDRDFVSALKLCLKPADLGANVRKLTGVENLVSSLHNMYSRVIDKMDTCLVAQINQFEHDVYGNLIAAYDSLNKLTLVPAKLLEAFRTRIDAKYDEISAGVDYNNVGKFKDSLQSLIDSSYSLLSVHQQIVAWHRGTAGYDSIRRAIEDMAKTLWDSIEEDATKILKKAPVTKLNFDSFDQLLKLTNGFIQFGATVVDMPGGALALAMDNITKDYFQLFHRNSLEAAGENLGFDTWASIPADSEFERQVLTLTIPVKEGTDVSLGMTSVNIQSAFPIDLTKITNSCSSIIKMLHQYLSMMKAVPSLSVEAINGIRELVEYYGFCVIHLFLKNSPVKPFEVNQNGKIVFLWQFVILLSNDDVQSLARIMHHFLKPVKEDKSPIVFPLTSMVDDNPNISAQQAITASDDMYAIGWYLESIRSYLEESLPENSLGNLRRFYSDIVSNFLKNFPAFCYQFIVPNLCDLSTFDQQVRATKYNINEPQVEPHSFCQTWIKVAKQFHELVSKFNADEKSKDNYLVAFWTYSSYILLNCFASVTKCTAEGRTSMLADYRHMAHEYLEFVGKRVHCDSDWVAQYIQAYFNNSTEFIKWAKENYKRYTMGQLIAIIETGLNDSIGRKDKAPLQASIKNLYKEIA
ncbi:hypothetical protein TRFO_32425 [Tritrichomonas foetus]|uniref:Exocyst complex component Sec8 n=1 Tax=Tritrichomonas foetus TaxID=1144522 RepID=A0A1J4JU21_9EUKA|nr:hypothetical protein TRFO_32425 [Tritrichomonas foetus]|eukprot:OHT00749.1 hypothetical protein TRFO_32425 [Tritrichomonas foetus]